jgi:hypothetical protein
MRVVTPTTASGASCVLGLQRAWAQPRRTDSSTCSATSSHTPSVGISQLECTCGKKKIGYGVGKKKRDRGAGAGKGPSARRGQKTQRPAFSHSFVGVCTPLVCTAGLSFCPCCSASAELTTRLFSASAELTTHLLVSASAELTTHLLVSASAELTTHIFSSGSTPPLYRRGKTTQRALRSAILSLESALPCS